MRDPVDATTEVSFATQGRLGIITLDRPKALNALTLAMIEAIAPRLRAWEADADVAAVIIRGAGDKAFCAGGDVRAVWEAGKALKAAGGYDPRTCPEDALPRRFFFAEYRLNRQIKTFAKPYVALIDGITMGGGVGLSVHGTFRVATERTLIAMPETAIGLFPDVGGSVFLPGCPGAVGPWLAVTGERLKGGPDAVASGFATHWLPAERIPALIDALAASSIGSSAGAVRAAVEAVLAELAEPASPAPLDRLRPWIDRCFAGERIETILAALASLEAEGGEGGVWAAAQRKTIASRSPTSIKLALAQLARGRGLDFDSAMVMEFRLAQSCMAGEDFYEGIRAVLVDKDQAPKWQPATLDGVSDAAIEACFAPLGARDLRFAP